MALTETQRKSRVVLFVGDVDEAGTPVSDGTGIIATNIDLLWDTYDGLGLYLRELYARRDAITMVLGRVSLTSDTAIGRDLGLSVKKSDRAKAYQKLLDDTNSLIASVNLGSFIGSASTIGELTTTTPVADADQEAFLEMLR
jgi:hypothetical protein